MNVWVPTIVAAISALAAIVSVVVTGRSARDTQAIQAETARAVARGQEEDNAGKLALDIAREIRRDQREIRGRLEVHEVWREDMIGHGGWVPRHEVRDRMVDQELAKLDPTFVPPAWEPLPRLRPYVPPPEERES